MRCAAVELASPLTAATILADATVAPTVSEMTYNVSSGTLNHTQPTCKSWSLTKAESSGGGVGDGDDGGQSMAATAYLSVIESL